MDLQWQIPRPNLRSILWPSLYKLEDDTIYIPLLNAVLFYSTIIAVVTVLIAPLYMPHTRITAYVMSSCILVSVLVARRLAHVGYVRAAAHLLVTILWLILTWPIVGSQGVYAPTFGGYSAVIVIAVILMGLRAGIVMAAASVAVGSAVAYMQVTGTFSAVAPSPIISVTSQLIFFVTVIAVTSQAYSRLQSALVCSKQSQDEYLRSNQLLTESSAHLAAAKRAYQVLSACNQAMFRAQSESELLEQVCAVLTEIGGYQFAAVTFGAEESEARLRLVALSGEAHRPYLDRILGGALLPEAPILEAVRGRDLTVLGQNQLHDPRQDGASNDAPSSHALIIMPLVQDDSTLGSIVLGSALDDPMTPDEAALMTALADDIVYGLTALRVDALQQDAAEKLRANNDLLRATLASIDQAVFVLDGPDRIVRICNRAATDMFGYAPEELIGNPISMIHPSEQSYEQFLRRRMENLTATDLFHTPYVAYHRNGKRIHLDVTVRPLGVAGSHLAGEVSVLRDVTQEFEHTELLQRSEERYRSLFNSMSEGVSLQEMVFDADGTPIDLVFLDVNPAFEHVTSLRRDDVVGRSMLGLIPHHDSDILATYTHVAKTGEAINRLQYLPEMARYLDVSIFADQSGRYVTTFHDVTGRVLAEAKLVRSEAMFRSMAETTLAATFMAQDAQLIYANPAAESLFGHSREALLSMSVWDLIDPAMLAEVQGEFLKLARRESERIRMQFKATTKTDEVRWFDCSACLLEHEGDLVTLGICFDITAQVVAQESLQAERALLAHRVNERTAELKRANSELAQSARHKDEFLASMSHELRTP
ncbi:MAG: PAS domain S-box protein [Caldilineaceae bacterium]